MNAPAPHEVSLPPESDRGLAKVLVVDDDPQNLMAMEVALESISCQQVQVRSGAAALRELLRQEFSVILLDVQMPDMDGFETARLIRSREKNRDVPIIFVTAYSQDDNDARRGYELGAVDYLFKPIVTEILCAKVQALIELRERAQQVSRQARQLRAMERAEAENRLAEERRNWEAEALRLQNQYLEENDRRKDEFLAVLAHELRNPMAPIVNSLELMAAVGLTDPQLRKAHKVMDRQVRHLTRLVDDLLDVSRISQGKLELHRHAMDLEDAASQAIEACENHLKDKDQTLYFSAPDEPIMINGDAVRVVQVIANLLHNASRYSEEKGEIYVSLGIDNSRALIRVRDSGRGIHPEAQARIFDMFIQERAGGNGLGLGLSLVKQIVHLHGGDVSVHSEGVGKGSEFLVRLPVSGQEPFPGEELLPQSERPTSRRSIAPAPLEEHRALRIALVEDDDDIRDTLTTVLEQWGHSVESAADGPSGIELVCKMQPDIALLDIGLPGLNGHGVAEAICARLGAARPHLVALSGYGQKSDRERSSRAGFDEHLVKPAQPGVLKRILADIPQKKA
jgi:two-component system, sensor histidine kinase